MKINYKQAPFQQITQEEYNNFLEKMPKDVDWSLLGEYEENDMTTGVQELSCTSGQCEI